MARTEKAAAYNDLQATLQKAMKAYEAFDVDIDDPNSCAEARLLWDAAMAANGDLIKASTR